MEELANNMNNGAMPMADETRLVRLKKAINDVQDFPKPGIVFRDIFPLFKDPALVVDVISLMVEYVREKHKNLDVVVGLESRGFLFGPMMAIQLGCSFVPIRKKGKLPGKCVQQSYELEYGVDTMEAQADAIQPGQKVLIFDDLLATGGTMSAAAELVTKIQGVVLECLVLIELVDLKGSAKLKHPYHSMVQF